MRPTQVQSYLRAWETEGEMTAYWGQNIIIDGSRGLVDFDDVIPYEPPLRFSRSDPRSTSDPLARDFESKTLQVLQAIAASNVGKIILLAICFNSRRLTIVRLNDLAIGKTGAIPRSEASAAAGGCGSDVEIRFDPQTWISSDEERSYDPGHHYHADDVLLHEMVHALRMMRGLRQNTPVVDYDNVEDLISIMISNIYLSASGRNNDLRGSHNLRFTPLRKNYFQPTEPMKDSAFYIQYSVYIDPFIDVMPDICNQIAGIPANLCKWNPLRARIEYIRDVSRMF